jgi:hypothetical protein
MLLALFHTTLHEIRGAPVSALRYVNTVTHFAELAALFRQSGYQFETYAALTVFPPEEKT